MQAASAVALVTPVHGFANVRPVRLGHLLTILAAPFDWAVARSAAVSTAQSVVGGSLPAATLSLQVVISLCCLSSSFCDSLAAPDWHF